MGKELLCLRGSTKNVLWGSLGNFWARKAGVATVEGALGGAVGDGWLQRGKGNSYPVRISGLGKKVFLLPMIF